MSKEKEFKSEKVMSTPMTVFLALLTFFSVIILTIGIIGTVIVVKGIDKIPSLLPSFPDATMLIAANDGGSDSTNLATALAFRYLSTEASGNIEGSFKGRFTTTKVRSLEKVNLSCIDEYEFVKFIPASNIANQTTQQFLAKVEFQQKLENRGCSMVSEYDYWTLWKCPLHNCAMKEVITEEMGEFIPESVDIRKVNAEIQAGGK